MNINKILDQQSNTNDDLELLLNSYYSIDNYNFSNEDHLREYIYDKFNPLNRDLYILDKEYIINDMNQILNSDSGILLFDLSMTNDDTLYKNLYLLTTNFKNINLHLIEDNYIIEYDTNENNTKENNLIDKIKLENGFKNLFTTDINRLIVKQQINNIPHLIHNDRFISKLSEDLTFSNLKSFQNTPNIEIMNKYKKDLNLNLSSTDYKVNYIFTVEAQHIENILYDNILNELDKFNTYIDDIVDRMYKIDHTMTNQVRVKDLFKRNYLNDLYAKDQSIDQLIMTDVLDKKLDIISVNNRSLTIEEFYNNMLRFLNELVKKKIIKVIKLNNLNLI